MQRRKWSQNQEVSPGHTTPASHSPQQWFRSSSNRSVPNLAKSHHQKRPSGFSSIRDLARTSRRPLATLSTNASQSSAHTLGSSSSLYGTLRDQCSPPPPLVPELPAPTAVVPRRSQSSEINSVTPDHSGASIDFTHLTTPSSAQPIISHELAKGSSSSLRNMGNKASSIAKKHHSVTEKPNGAKFDDEKGKLSSFSIKNQENRPPAPPATFSPRGSSPTVQVPRRRSSLTALLSSSEGHAKDSKRSNSQRESNPDGESLLRRSSTLAETIRPVISKASTLTPANVAQKARETTLSPPLLSPGSRLSSTSSLVPSMPSPGANPRSSVVGARIHLPVTFPDGPVEIDAHPLVRIQYVCYMKHKDKWPSMNHEYKVPCQTCKANPDDGMVKCSWCELRICGKCWKKLEEKNRSLQELLDWLAENKHEDDDEKKEVVAGQVAAQESLEKKDGDGKKGKEKEEVEKEMEELALKKVETARKRETR